LIESSSEYFGETNQQDLRRYAATLSGISSLVSAANGAGGVEEMYENGS
jgi:hypothetical protein